MREQDFLDRLIRLEENFYFLDEKVSQLDRHIREQQRALDTMEKNIRLLTNMAQEMRALIDGSQKTHQQEDPPPHHEPRLW